MTDGSTKMGRPSTYDPVYCERVIEWGRQGKSIVWMAAEIGVARSTLEAAWPTANPEFSEALGIARLHSQRWWEDAGQAGMTAPGFNGSVYSRSMAARFPHDWREKTLHGSDPDNPLPAATLSLSGLSEAALRELAGAQLVGDKPE